MSTHINVRTLLLLGILVAPAAVAGPIPNGSFESDSIWTTVSYGAMLVGGYSQEWSSDGTWSYKFERLTGGVTGGHYLGIEQAFDLTGVTGFLFDAQDQGVDAHDPIQFLIDNVLVGQWSNNGWPGGQGSGWGHTAQTYDIAIPLADVYTGVHTLTIRYWIQISHFPADPKIYWLDNLRTVGGGTAVPEPATWVLLAFCAPAILVRKFLAR